MTSFSPDDAVSSFAALVALRVKESMPELEMMHRWLDNWAGVGLITTGMERQGYALSLTKITDDGWRATSGDHSVHRQPWTRTARLAQN